MMKKINVTFIVSVLICFAFNSQAQQSSKMWQWTQNPYSVSPALIGINQGVDVTAYYTNHFANVPNSARNMGVMASGKMPNQNAGIGINLSREIVGFENVFNGLLSYNYGLKISKELELKMGLSLGLIHQNFNTNGLYYHDMDESTVDAINSNPERSAFDANIGLAVVNKDYYFGVSTNRFLKNELEYEANNKTYGFLYQQRINAIAGYTFNDVAKDIDLKTNFLFEYQKNSPAFTMANVQAVYQKLFWLGLGYGSDNLIAANAGLQVNNNMKVGYSYLIGSLSDQYKLGGGHEIMLTATLGNTKPKIIKKTQLVTKEVIVRDTIYVEKTDTIYKEVIPKSEDLEPKTEELESKTEVIKTKKDTIVSNVAKPKELKTKENLKRDAEDNIVVDQLIPLQNEKIDTAKIVFKDVTTEVHSAGYYVIIGSFDVQENADNFLKSMLIEGKQSYKIYDTSNSRFYIYIDYSLEEAVAKKVQTENPQYEGIWVKQIE